MTLNGPILSFILYIAMIIATPSSMRKAFYFNLNTKPRVRDEILAVTIGAAYFGANRTELGFEIVWGKLDENEVLW